MRSLLVTALAAVALLAGCTGRSSIKPEEVLDERTGMTVGALESPIELVEKAEYAAPGGERRASFAYLGPVEWDRSGDLTYGLWLHVAPGNDKQVASIRAAGAVTLQLADGSQQLQPIAGPDAGRGPYRPVAEWGQTAYFALDTAMLQRLAASPKIALALQAADGSEVDFVTTRDNRTTLSKYLRARGITAD